jgi:oligopeptidase B
VDHYGDHFYVRTNDGAKNFRLMRTPVEATGRSHWEEVISGRPDTLLADFEIFRSHLAVVERSDALVRLRIRPWSGDGEHYVAFDQPAYAASPTNNYDFDTELIRFQYSSLTTPLSV